MYHKSGHTGNISPIIAIAIIIAAGIGVWANSGTLIPNGDDFCFAFKIVSDSEVTDALHRQPLTSFPDILDGQKIHYAESHGRIPLIILSQLFGGLWDFSIYRVINTIIFCLTAFIMCRLTIPGNPMTAVLVTAVLLFIMPEAGFLYNSPVFSINYLWTLFITLCGIMIWKRNLWYLSPLMFIAGWSHEAFSIPIAGAMTLTLIRHIVTLKRSGSSNMMTKEFRQRLAILLFYGAGALILILSPGNFLRLTHAGGVSGGILSSILHRGYNMLSNVWVLLFFAWICSFRFIRNKNYKARYIDFCRNNIFIISTVGFSIIFLLLLGTFKGRSGYALTAFSVILYLRFFRQSVTLLSRPKYYIIPGLLTLLLQWGVIKVNAEQRHAYDEIISSYLTSPDGAVATSAMPRIPFWAKPWANTYNPVIIPGDLFDALTRSSAADYYAHPNHSPLLTFSNEELHLLKEPDSLFVEKNRVPGSADFYTTSSMEHFIRKSDTRDTAGLKDRTGFIYNSIHYTSVFPEEDGRQLNWKKRLKSLFSPLPTVGTLSVQTIIIDGHRYEIATKDSPYPITAINRPSTTDSHR